MSYINEALHELYKLEEVNVRPDKHVADVDCWLEAYIDTNKISTRDAVIKIQDALNIDENTCEVNIQDTDDMDYPSEKKITFTWDDVKTAILDTEDGQTYFEGRIEEDDREILDSLDYISTYDLLYSTDYEECLNEAMSEEDEQDSTILKGIVKKLNARRNAKLTPEEQAVLDKYELHKSTWDGSIRDKNNNYVAGTLYRDDHQKLKPEYNLADKARKTTDRFEKNEPTPNIYDEYNKMKADLRSRKYWENEASLARERARKEMGRAEDSMENADAYSSSIQKRLAMHRVKANMTESKSYLEDAGWLDRTERVTDAYKKLLKIDNIPLDEDLVKWAVDDTCIKYNESLENVLEMLNNNRGN